jgi:Coenzyme PQQ synthesis protein D (PqqD)
MTYRLTSQQISSQMGDETVILNHKEGVYFNVEGVGSVIWQRLQEAPQTLIKAVMDEFDTDEATCRPDIEAFLDELMHEKLVEMA